MGQFYFLDCTAKLNKKVIYKNDYRNTMSVERNSIDKSPLIVPRCSFLSLPAALFIFFAAAAGARVVTSDFFLGTAVGADNRNFFSFLNGFH